MSNSCIECVFFKKALGLGQKTGECRRFPPNADMGGVWPIIGWHEWCGEFKSSVIQEKKMTEVLDLIERHVSADEKQQEELPHRIIYEKEKY